MQGVCVASSSARPALGRAASGQAGRGGAAGAEQRRTGRGCGRQGRAVCRAAQLSHPSRPHPTHPARRLDQINKMELPAIAALLEDREAAIRRGLVLAGKRYEASNSGLFVITSFKVPARPNSGQSICAGCPASCCGGGSVPAHTQ